MIFSNEHNVCVSKTFVYTSIGCHTFNYAAPQIWNGRL